MAFALLHTLCDLLWPPRCPACEREAFDADPREGLCSLCAQRLEPPVERCRRCARPVGPHAPGSGVPGPSAAGNPSAAAARGPGPDPEREPAMFLREPPLLACRRCAAERWPLDGIVAGQGYRGVARALVMALKFRQRVQAARPLGRRLTEALEERDLPGDLLVPVPLSARRERRRGYNQAALLANEVSRRTGLETDAGALVRLRHDPAQSGQPRGRRRRGPRGAFRARPSRVQGRCALLVDDVLTSGATALAAARALVRGGALSVVVAVACRSEGHPGAEREAEVLGPRA